MTAPNVRNVIRSPGRLVKNPTDLSAVYPHGGTELGVARLMEFRFGLRTETLVAEEWQQPVAVLTTGELAVMAGVLRTWDNDLVADLFPNTSTGSSTGDAVVSGLANSGNRAGYDMGAKAVKLLFSPQAVDDHPMILVYRAVPLPEDAAALTLAVTREYGIGFMFVATPDSSGRLYRVGKRDDLVGLL